MSSVPYDKGVLLKFTRGYENCKGTAKEAEKGGCYSGTRLGDVCGNR